MESSGQNCILETMKGNLITNGRSNFPKIYYSLVLYISDDGFTSLHIALSEQLQAAFHEHVSEIITRQSTTV